MRFEYVVELFNKFGNANDTVYLIDADSEEYLGSLKVKELKNTVNYIRVVKGFASRGFNPKVNSFVDGFFIYCKVRY